jgi:hypothetical protein
MHFALLSVLTDRHPLFEALRQTLTLTHLRTLAQLLAPGGRALLITDLSSSEIHPLGETASPAELMQELVQGGSVFGIAHPGHLRAIANDDPVLQKLEISEPLEAWIWHDGPSRRFLVYALELARPR